MEQQGGIFILIIILCVVASWSLVWISGGSLLAYQKLNKPDKPAATNATPASPSSGGGSSPSSGGGSSPSSGGGSSPSSGGGSSPSGSGGNNPGSPPSGGSSGGNGGNPSSGTPGGNANPSPGPSPSGGSSPSPPAPAAVVRIYRNCKVGQPQGVADPVLIGELGLGEWRGDKLRAGNSAYRDNDTERIVVPAGLKVTIYKNSDLTGEGPALAGEGDYCVHDTSGVSNTGAGGASWNNKISGFKVLSAT
jgi:hypothetical protein